MSYWHFGKNRWDKAIYTKDYIMIKEKINLMKRSRSDQLTDKERSAGTLKNRIPIRIDGKTIIFVKEGTDIDAMKRKYDERNDVKKFSQGHYSG